MTTTHMVGGRVVAQPKKVNRLFVAAGVLAAIFGLGWAALLVKPAPFPPVSEAAKPPATVPLPTGLPTPVEKFYRMQFGDQVPVINTAVISGRGTMRLPPLFNLTLPVRFRFTHEAGRNYRHYIEATLFGLPVLKVNEYYVDGVERQELPWVVATDNPKLDQGGNLGMWAELMKWLPSVLVTDPNVRWEAIDKESAILVVPFGNDEDRFVVRFGADGSEIAYWETMRYANGEGEKTLWVNGAWFDDGKPWFVVLEEDVVVNIPVDTSVTAKGP